MNKPLSFPCLLLAIACGGPVEDPSPNPPPPWGVPITGGTMLVTNDGRHAVIADPDRDRIVTVDLAKNDVVGELSLEINDEPGRLIEDGDGRIHVALRRGGGLLTLTGPRGPIAERRPACGEPRGLAWQPAGDLVHVACASGELVTFAAAGGNATRVVRLERDLRDVIVRGGELVVTRFRSAELLTLDAQGAIATRVKPPITKRLGKLDGTSPPDGSGSDGRVDAIPAVAWRTIALADGSLLMVHQRQVQGALETEPGGYGGGCGNQGPVEAAITIAQPGQPIRAVAPLVSGALPVDIAVSAQGTVAVAVAGSKIVQTIAGISLRETDDDDDDCRALPPGGGGLPGGTEQEGDGLGAPTAVAWTPSGTDLLIYYPELPALVVRKVTGPTHTIRITGDFGYDSGRALFHKQTASGLACASCHPEGREDGLVWDFETLGRRRTQSVAGSILSRAPYHWIGDMTDLSKLMQDVFASRMSGGQLTRSELLSLGPWLDRIPAPTPVVVDAAAVARGRALFDSVEVGCATCHVGAVYTNNLRVNVGTGNVFKAPSLRGVGARAPFMHDGCAATLRDRFTPTCGGGDLHGKTSQLTPAQIDDLVAFLESL